MLFNMSHDCNFNRQFCCFLYRYEKLISGKYLGETVRLVLQSLIKDGSLFGGKSSPKFDTFEKFETKYLSFIEGGYVHNYYSNNFSL